MFRLFIWVYSLLFPLIFLFYSPFYLVHILKRGGLTVDFWERLGIFPQATKERLKALNKPVWIHAVSVGETVAAATFIKTWREREPQLPIVFSCGTSTGFATALKKLPKDVVCIYCPIDFCCAVRHTLNLVKPSRLVIFEVEIWPNLIYHAAKRGIKVDLVNGRMSDKSAKGYAKWQCVFAPLFRCFDLLCVQTQEDARRLELVIGQDNQRIKVCDTMKFDQVPDQNGADKSPELREAFGPVENRMILTLGSTHPGEEELFCRAIKKLAVDFPNLRTVLVPRHQERGAEVAEIVKASGLSYKLVKGAEENQTTPVQVLIVNTTGELMNYYAACDIAYVGKSLGGQEGGHNMIEPAIFGKPIFYGPHVENFRQVAALFKENEAAWELTGDQELEAALRRLLSEPELRQKLGNNARKLVERYHGAINRTLDHLIAG